MSKLKNGQLTVNYKGSHAIRNGVARSFNLRKELTQSIDDLKGCLATKSLAEFKDALNNVASITKRRRNCSTLKTFANKMLDTLDNNVLLSSKELNSYVFDTLIEVQTTIDKVR